jgi:hypothetical protein
MKHNTNINKTHVKHKKKPKPNKKSKKENIPQTKNI